MPGTVSYLTPSPLGLGTVVDVFERPWPGVDGKSVQYEFGKRGMGCRVSALAGPDKPGGYISWRDGKYKTVEDAEEMIALLREAVATIKERHP